jgi:hypothetical protein
MEAIGFGAAPGRGFAASKTLVQTVEHRVALKK